MALKGGTLTSFNDSMARAIEIEFERIWSANHGGKALPESSQNERRWMFAAIATGVVNHLASHETGFHINLPVNEHNRVVGNVDVRKE